MFCVKCGEDVGKFRFCPHCGTQVPEMEDVVWSIGMACPHCGGTKLEGDCCAFCGAQLMDDPCEDTVPEENVSIERLYGGYGNFGEGVHIAKDHMSIFTKKLLKRKEYTVPYGMIRRVKYSRTESMAVRLSITWYVGEGAQTEEVIITRWRHLNLFCALAYVIRCLVPHQIEVCYDVSAAGEKELNGGYATIDWDALVLQFGTNRFKAIQQVCREYAVPEKLARRMVDIAFEERQLLRYASDPWLAVRDMDRIIREWDE